jgi:hypothetical protein
MAATGYVPFFTLIYLYTSISKFKNFVGINTPRTLLKRRTVKTTALYVAILPLPSTGFAHPLIY